MSGFSEKRPQEHTHTHTHTGAHTQAHTLLWFSESREEVGLQARSQMLGRFHPAPTLNTGKQNDQLGCTFHTLQSERQRQNTNKQTT